MSTKSSPKTSEAGNKKKVQSVRLNPYKRLLHRFYEPLILLEALGKTRAEPDDKPEEHLDRKARRRRIQDNISYLCDTKKGGPTTSAAAFEQTRTGIDLWIASNVSDAAAKKNVEFLRRVLTKVPYILSLQGQDRLSEERSLISDCIIHAKSRIVKEIAQLYQAAEDMKPYLGDQPESPVLARWLLAFADIDVLDMPWYAYSHRHASEMRIFELHMDKADEKDHKTAFGKFRHSLGRLASHIRAPKQLLEDLNILPHLYGVQAIRLIDPGLQPTPPELDGQSTLRGILTRMLPRDDASLEDYYESLLDQDRLYKIWERVEDAYKNGLKPRIHAEVQVAEHFYHNKLAFVDDDAYIGCSKPSCYCCFFYFKHHPGRLAKRRSHYKIWLQWGLPGLLPSDPKKPNHFNKQDPKFRYQLDLLNKVTADIRKEALDHLSRRAAPAPWHPDSTTGITNSVRQRDMDADSTLAAIAEGVQEMSLGRDSAKTFEATIQQGKDELEEVTTFGQSFSYTSEAPSLSSGITDEVSSSDDSDSDGGVPLE